MGRRRRRRRRLERKGSFRQLPTGEKSKPHSMCHPATIIYYVFGDGQPPHSSSKDHKLVVRKWSVEVEGGRHGGGG